MSFLSLSGFFCFFAEEIWADFQKSSGNTALNVNKMASCAIAATKDLFEKYKKFVENNVETVGHLESAARILSYIVPGILFCD